MVVLFALLANALLVLVVGEILYLRGVRSGLKNPHKWDPEAFK
jgi:hypothetical protein